MNYMSALENLRKKVQTNDPVEQASAMTQPVRPQGFMPNVARSSVMNVRPRQTQELEYNPAAITEKTLRSIFQARQKFEQQLAKQQKKEQQRPSGFVAGVLSSTSRPSEEEIPVGTGFLTRPQNRDDTLREHQRNRNSIFDSTNRPRGPAGQNIGGGLLALIDRTEGGGEYDTLFGFSNREGPFSGVDVSNMTLAEAIEFSSPDGEYGQWVKSQVGRVATPMGRYQIVGTTLRNAVEELGLSLDTKFDADTQDLIAEHLARRRLDGASSMAQRRQALRNEWEGFKYVSDEELNSAIMDFLEA